MFKVEKGKRKEGKKVTITITTTRILSKYFLLLQHHYDELLPQ